MSRILLEKLVKEMIESILKEDDGTFASTAPARPSAARQQAVKRFDLNEFKKLPGIEEKLNYLRRTIQQIGEGSSRAVFKLSDKLVLKMAKNPAGVGQNKAEATVCAADPQMEFFTKIADKDPGGEWLISDLAKPMSEGEFKSSTGADWKKFQSALIALFPEKTKGKVALDQNKVDYEEVVKIPFFKKLFDVVKECKYEPGDIAKLDSWGIVNGNPVIIDSGFTEAVQQKYYTPDLAKTSKL